MKTLFAIGGEKKQGDVLLLEIGKDYCSCGRLDKAARTFEQIRYFSFPEWENEDSIRQVLDDLSPDAYQQVLVSSALPSALLVPRQFFYGNYSYLDVVYDLPRQQYLNDPVNEWQLVTLYSMPLGLRELLQSRFPEARYVHAYTAALKIYNGFVAPDQIDIHFSPQHFRVLVKKENMVQLVQVYSYQQPLDVIYFLLKICYEFGLEQSAVFLIISGLVDKDSALYSELHNYFLNLHFAQPSDWILPESALPAYYFTPLYNLAACVS